MKQYLAILLLILISQAGNSQTVDDLFQEFSKAEEINYVQFHDTEILRITLKGITANDNAGINNIEILDSEKCSKKVKERFNQAIKNLKDPRFETLITSNESNCRRKVMVCIEEETIRELVILATGQKGNTVIRIKGKIKPSDIDQILKIDEDGC